MLRIIGGQFRGRLLKQPNTALTRPTTDKVKEALFSILNSQFLRHQQVWSDHCAIDFFAGSGSLIFESLSRGASFGLAIDNGPEALHTIKQNQDALKISDAMMIQNLDVNNLPPATQQFSVIFLDPPYSFKKLDQLIHSIIEKKWTKPNAWFAFELSAEVLTPECDQIEILVERTYGNIKIAIGRLRS